MHFRRAKCTFGQIAECTLKRKVHIEVRKKCICALLTLMVKTLIINSGINSELLTVHIIAVFRKKLLAPPHALLIPGAFFGFCFKFQHMCGHLIRQGRGAPETKKPDAFLRPASSKPFSD